MSARSAQRDGRVDTRGHVARPPLEAADMTYFADLTVCDYFGIRKESLLAVGWLEAEHPHATGPVTAELFGALATLLESPWQPFAAAGWHNCSYPLMARCGFLMAEERYS